MAPFNDTQVAAGLPLQLSKTTPLEQAGMIIHKTKGMLKAVFNVANQSGGTAPAGNYPLVDDLGNAAVLPNGAIVTNVVVAPVTSFVGASGTVAFFILNAADLVAATGIASLSSTSNAVAGKPIGTAATWLPQNGGITGGTVQDPYSNALGVQVQATVATTTQTAGACTVFIEYVIL